VKKILSICFCLALLVSVASCSNLTDGTENTGSIQSVAENVSSETASQDPFDDLKKYTSDSGITIYMADGFTEKDFEGEGIECYMESNDCILTCRVETFELLANLNIDTNMTVEEYGQLVIDANQFDSELKTDDYGNVYMEYVQNIDGIDFTYYGYFKKGTDAFWTCNLVCQTSRTAEFEDQFALWASSIELA